MEPRMAAQLDPTEIAARAGEWTLREWVAIQERFATVVLSNRQREDWVAIKVELEVDREAWRQANTYPHVTRAEYSQLLWAHCRLLARFEALLLGTDELVPEEIDEDAITAFMLFTEDECETELPTMY
jgi:hypothetical protein